MGMLENINAVEQKETNMQNYNFHSAAPEAMRDSLVLTLRKDGFSATRETDTLRTNATQAQIALSFGLGWVVRRAHGGWDCADLSLACRMSNKPNEYFWCKGCGQWVRQADSK